MSAVRTETKYYQECDICKGKFELSSAKETLATVVLPMTYFVGDGSRRLTTNKLSVCGDCLAELDKLLGTKYEMYEVDYGGVICRRL